MGGPLECNSTKTPDSNQMFIILFIQSIILGHGLSDPIPAEVIEGKSHSHLWVSGDYRTFLSGGVCHIFNGE